MSAAVRLLSIWRDPPDWIVWARPMTDTERRELARAVDLVITLDVGEDAEKRIDYGTCDIGVGVRWYDDRRTPDVATFALARDAEGVTPWMTWLRDIRRDMRRNAHGRTYERGHIIVLDDRGATHARR